MQKVTVHKKTFFILWALSIIGSLSVLPYTSYLISLPSTISLWQFILFGTIQSALFFGLACWISLKLLPKTDLNPFPSIYKEHFLKNVAYPALISGISVGLLLFGLDRGIFSTSILTGDQVASTHIPLWARLLASLYGGVSEEILLRLFFFTLIYFLVGKCLKIREGNRSLILWSVNLFVALFFGLGHLPAALHLGASSPFEISRIFVLNGAAGLVFGWLYWSRGLLTAMLAHFMADLMIHVIL
jgi:hypothetical protein